MVRPDTNLAFQFILLVFDNEDVVEPLLDKRFNRKVGI